MLRYPEQTETVEQDFSSLSSNGTGFIPRAPETLEMTRLSPVLLEELLLKVLLAKGSASGRDMAEAICLPFKIIQPLLSDMKARMLVSHRTTDTLGDFIYALTDTGKHTAMVAREQCAYAGAVPVMYDEYVSSVYAQGIRNESPKVDQLKAAYADIVIADEVLNTLGPAINSGRGIFLFGEPGNGKTTLAERITNCFTSHIYIPKALWIEGDIVLLYDPQTHELVEEDESSAKLDQRWVKIKRPTVMVGGELTMESLEIQYNHVLKVSEAPLQMKANCGTFLIDDFGRQRIDHRELLNRWIVPLEKRYDFQVLANGKKIQVPFDQLIVFSTNLNPADLVDEAFLRRIPYKIEISSPDEALFRHVFQFQCNKYGIVYDDSMVSYLIQTHYMPYQRQFRVCHARDILDQVINSSVFYNTEPQMTSDLLDMACKNYFAAMDVIQH